MDIKPPKNRNYCATVVQLEKFETLPNCDNVKHAIIFNNRVIVSKDAHEGKIGLFFPVETQLMPAFLSANNLYRDAEKNLDTSKKGYFEDHGRIKAIKFRGHVSEGFFIPFVTSLPIGSEFDELDGIEICRKYVPAINPPATSGKKKVKQAKEIEIIPGQFAFHYDTSQLRRNVHRISPFDFITITDKWHGTSAVFANVLAKRKLRWYEKILTKLGVKINDEEYTHIWSSRKVVKGIGKPLDGKNHYYGSDVWGEWAAKVCPLLPKGCTVYGEIVGYTSGGRAIQKGYPYLNKPGESSFHVYRVTFTSPGGEVIELDSTQLFDFCKQYKLNPVVLIWQGFAWQIEPVKEDDEWSKRFLEKIEKLFITNNECMYNPGVPMEGIVLRVEKGLSHEAYKLKSWAFLERETKMLDKGEIGEEE